MRTYLRMVKPSSLLKVELYDNRRLKKKDRGLLGEVTVRVEEILGLSLDRDGILSLPRLQLKPELLTWKLGEARGELTCNITTELSEDGADDD